MRTLTLRNEYHNTVYQLRLPDTVTGDVILSPYQVRRCRRALCGRADCTCGGPLNERGPQDRPVEIHYLTGDCKDICVRFID